MLKSVGYELVGFLEGAFVKQQRNALAYGELAFFVLSLAPLFAAAFFGKTVTALEFLERFSAYG
jgi:hypothetical protein